MYINLESLVLVTGLLAAGSNATPVNKHKGFSVGQVPVPATRPNGVGAVRMAYKRYGKTVPPHVKKAAMNQLLILAKLKLPATKNNNVKGAKNKSKPKQKDGKAEATPSFQDEEYVCTVSVGGQNVKLDFDTGSSDLWVYSSKLPIASMGNHSIYDPAKSKTSKELPGMKWDITYGDGSGASGSVYTDVVNVGGAEFKTQAVETASKVSDQFLKDFSNDGLLGLAFDNINSVTPAPQKTFFTNVRPTLQQPLFTVDLKHAAPGSYDFGFIDDKKYAGSIKYMDVDSKDGFWAVESSGYAIGGDGKTLTSRKLSTIIDTGTTLMLIPQDMLEAYYKKVPNAKNDNDQGGYVFPCDTKLPDYYVGLGGYTAKIPGSMINNGPVTQGSKTCFGGIQFSEPSSGPQAIFGDVFLKSSFVVFKAPEKGTPTIGFASKAGMDVVPAPTSTVAPSSTATPTPTPSTTPPTDGTDGGDDGGDDGDESDGDYYSADEGDYEDDVDEDDDDEFWSWL